MSRDSCRSEVGLDLLAQGMAKQYDSYQDALQEFVDNAIASRVPSEAYFENPDVSIEVEVVIHRYADVVETVVADNGPGIPREALQNDVFRTGNKSVSDGILNNVGWGLKASLAWFEHTLGEPESLAAEDVFSLVTRTSEGKLHCVDGPITGDLPIRMGYEEDWVKGLVTNTNLSKAETGTRVRATCTREQFDNDVWPSSNRLEIKIQTLRERFGLFFRRLLDAHEDNRIVVSYVDHVADQCDSFEVLPLHPIFVDNEDERGEFTFSIETEDGATYTIEYEKGTIDFDAMREQFENDHPELFTSGGNFRTRLRPSQVNQGIDVYANGRVLMTSVFEDLYDRTRNNEFNYFGGILRIFPDDPQDEVPTDNKKTRIDTTSDLWTQLSQKLSVDPYRPIGKDYQGSEIGNEVTDTDSLEENGPSTSEKSKSLEQNEPSELSADDKLFGMHNGDTRNLLGNLETLADGEQPTDGLVDVTITSPPYGDIKDYGYDPDQQVGFGSSYNAYLEELREIFCQVYDVTRPDGTLWVVVNTFNQGGQMYNLPADIARTLQNLSAEEICPRCSTSEVEVPLVQPHNSTTAVCRNCQYTPEQGSWTLQDMVIWDKKRALPYSGQGKLRNVFEYVLFFSKSEDYRFDLDDIRVCDPAQFKDWWVDYPERYHPRGKVPDNIWEMITPSQGAFGFDSLDHPAPFPPMLVERILQLTTRDSDIVLDPFAGSGMVLAQAEAMDRRPIGFELNESYVENYPALKEELHEYLETEESVSLSEARDNLAEIIGGLRQLKLIHRLFHHLAEDQNAGSPAELDIQAALHSSRKIDSKVHDSEKFMNMDLTLLVDEGAPEQRVQQLVDMANQRLAMAPLTAYGVQTKVAVQRPSDVMRDGVGSVQSVPDHELFLYTDNHFWFEEELAHDDWMNALTEGIQHTAFGDRFPPILSNLGLQVRNPRRDNPVESARMDEPIVHKLQRAPSVSETSPAWVEESSLFPAD